MCSGMHPGQVLRHPGKHLSLMLCQSAESFGNVVISGDFLSQSHIRSVMSGLAGQEATIKISQLRVVEMIGEQFHALAASCLDQGETEQGVEEPIRLAGADGGQ